MNRLGNKGFTLIEIIASLVILCLVMGLGAYSITVLIAETKKNNYELLIKEIKSAVEVYYQECKYMNNNNCQEEITLGFLLSNGYLKGNGSDITKLVNPLDNVDISDCKIKYRYLTAKGELEFDYDDSKNKSCPEVR